MKSLVQFIKESCNKKCKKMNPKRLKEIRKMMKKVNLKDYKRNPKLEKYFKKNVKEAAASDESFILNDFTNWVENTIDYWCENTDDDHNSVAELMNDLDSAVDYFGSEEFETTFCDTYGYDPKEIKFTDKMEDIVLKCIESTKRYIKNTYDHTGTDEDWDDDNDDDNDDAWGVID